MSDDRYNVSAVERALDVLDAFSAQRPELSLTEIASITKLHKATAFRLLATLCHRGMAMKNPASGLYRLGFGVIALSEVAKTSTGFVSQARPCMRRVRDELNETVYIAVRVGDERISLDQLEGCGTSAAWWRSVSRRHFMSAAPAGFCSPRCRTTKSSRISPVPTFVPPFPGAKVDAPTLWRAIAEIRRDGFAETHNKRIDEGASISAAVRGPANEVVGALTVSVPIGRYSAEVRARAIDVVTEAARACLVSLARRNQ